MIKDFRLVLVEYPSARGKSSPVVGLRVMLNIKAAELETQAEEFAVGER